MNWRALPSQHMHTSFPGRLQCLFFFFAMSRRGAAQRSLHRCLTEVRVSFLIPYANNSFLHVFLEATSDDRIHFCRILHVKKADLALGLHCVGSKGKQIHSTHQRAMDIFMGNSMQKKTCTCYVNAPLEKKKRPWEGGGRDEDSPATIYLIWLSWLHSRRPELLDAEAGTGRGRDAGKHGPQCGYLASLSMQQLTGPGIL